MSGSQENLTFYLSLTSAPSSPRLPITLPKSDPPATASDLRRLASEATSVPLASLKLIFRGRVIAEKTDGDVVKDFKLEHECVIHVMGKPISSAGGASASASAGANTTGGAASTVPTGASVSLPTAAAAPSLPSGSPISSALATLRSSNASEVYRTALTTADKLLGNIISHPMEEKYRTIKKSNPAFNRRLGGISGGEALLLASGFVAETGEGATEVFVLRPSAEAWPRLVEAREAVARALEEANRSSESAPAAAPGVPNLFPSGLPGTPSGGMGGPMAPGMEAAMQNMLSNPEALQSMMSNPMVQQMMRNDPRLANNPILQQSLQALSSNPDMIRQFSQLMGDPGMRANVSRMMEQQRQSGGASTPDPFQSGPEAMRRQMEEFQRLSQQFGGTSGSFNAGGVGGAAQPSTGGNGAPSTSGGGTGGSGGTNSGDDAEMTEEEMIAEAIARSLRES